MAHGAGRYFGGSPWSQERAGSALLLEGNSPNLLQNDVCTLMRCHCFTYSAPSVVLLVVCKTHCVLFSKMELYAVAFTIMKTCRSVLFK